MPAATRSTTFAAFSLLLLAACSAKGLSGSTSDVGESDAAFDGALSVYQGCTSGDLCTNSTCLIATYSSNGAEARVCSTACTRGEECPAAGAGARLSPICVVDATSGAGLCYRSCSTTADCDLSTTCALVPGTTSTRICVPNGSEQPCGTATQPCCSGAVCNAGLTCSDGVCTSPTAAGRPPYRPCVAGDACANSSCLTSIARVGGADVGSFCSVPCASGSTALCPGYVAGASTQTVTCLAISGAALAQCFRLCSTQNDCTPDGTVCAMFATAGGASVRVCVPTPSLN